MKPSIALLSIVVTLVIASAASGQRPGHDGRRLGVPEALGLDASTQAEVDAVVEEYRALSQSLNEGIDEVQSALYALLNDESPDKVSVLVEVDVLNSLEGQLRSARYAAMVDIYAFLTPEQREQLVTLRSQSREETLSICADDIERLCTEFQGRRGGLRCLAQSREELSAVCRDALPERRMRRGNGRMRRPDFLGVKPPASEE